MKEFLNIVRTARDDNQDHYISPPLLATILKQKKGPAQIPWEHNVPQLWLINREMESQNKPNPSVCIRYVDRKFYIMKFSGDTMRETKIPESLQILIYMFMEKKFKK